MGEEISGKIYRSRFQTNVFTYNLLEIKTLKNNLQIKFKLSKTQSPQVFTNILIALKIVLCLCKCATRILPTFPLCFYIKRKFQINAQLPAFPAILKGKTTPKLFFLRISEARHVTERKKDALLPHLRIATQILFQKLFVTFIINQRLNRITAGDKPRDR